MKRVSIILLLAITWSQISFASEADDPYATCGEFDTEGMTHALPIVLHTLFSERREDDVRSCIVMAFGLKKMKRYSGSLAPDKPYAIAQSEDVSPSDISIARESFESWLFSAKTYSVTKAPTYYYYIIF